MTATTGSTASSGTNGGGGGGNGKQASDGMDAMPAAVAAADPSPLPSGAPKEDKDKAQQTDSTDSKQTGFKRKSLKRDPTDLDDDLGNAASITNIASITSTTNKAPPSTVSLLGKGVKRFKVYNQDNVPVVYCEISIDGDKNSNNNNDDDDDNEESFEDAPKLQYTIRPFTGESFVVSVREHGCLFDLYDAIYAHTSILWDQQVISANGQVLASDEGSLLNTPLPECRELDLNVRMSSGMDSAPLNPDLDLSDSLSYDDDDAAAEQAFGGDNDRSQFKVTVSLDETQLAQLALLNITPTGTEEEPGDDSTASPPLVEKPAPTTPDTRLTGAAACHFCRAKCRPALQFTCKCGRTFCHLHRYHDQHRCPVDIVALDRQNLSKANPRVVKERL